MYETIRLHDIPTMSIGDQFTFRQIEFPQANDLRKVCRAVDLVAAHAEEIASRLDFVEREGAYYGSAAAALRLVVRRASALFFTVDLSHQAPVIQVELVEDQYRATKRGSEFGLENLRLIVFDPVEVAAGTP